MRDVKGPDEVSGYKGDSDHVTRMKRLLVVLGLKLGFEVDVEEEPESELGKLGIRHDVIWYMVPENWHTKLLDNMQRSGKSDISYRDLVRHRHGLKRRLHVAFEIEGGDAMTKSMKGDISNLSKWPYGVIIVYDEGLRGRFERALMEFRRLHGPNNVIIVSFEDIENLCKAYNLTL